MLLPVHVRREPANVPVCHDFARASQELQGRLKKAILEYVILQGSLISP